MSAFAHSIELVQAVAAAADEVKAHDTVAIDVSEPLGITDAFVITSGSSDRQVIAIADEIEKRLAVEYSTKPRSREGNAEGMWILLDYGDIVVHVMHDDARAFYDIERLWRDCPQIDTGITN